MRHKVLWRERYKGSKCICENDTHESCSGAHALPGLLGFLPFNAALRIPVSSEREQVYQH